MATKKYILPDDREIYEGQPFELNGSNYPRKWLSKASEDELDALGIVVEIVPDPEPEPPAPPTQEELLDYLANKRWQVEIGGTEFNGMMIATDRDSQTKIAAAWAKAKDDPEFTITNWKIGPEIFVNLDNSTIIAIGDAVTAHVQQCFNKEAELTAKILADPPEITTFEEIEEEEWT